LIKALKTIIGWCKENNQIIRKDKSGIMIFGPRLGGWKPEWKVGETIMGFPVVEKYKYLGFWVTPRMSLKPQKEYIMKKVGFIVNKLYPILNNVSLDYRINLWKIMARPLFDQLLCALSKENSSTNVEEIITMTRQTFKRFTLLGKTVPNKIVEHLMDYKVTERATT
jgi:hypothetical protein